MQVRPRYWVQWDKWDNVLTIGWSAGVISTVLEWPIPHEHSVGSI